MQYLDIEEFHIYQSEDSYELFDEEWDGCIARLPLEYSQKDIKKWISGYKTGYKIGKDFGQICGESNIRIAIKKALDLN